MIAKRHVNLLLFNARQNLYFSTKIRTLVHRADIQENKDINEKYTDAEWKNALPYEKIPGPTTFSLVKNFLPGGKFYKGSRVNFMKSLFNDYGELFRINASFGSREMVFTRDPANFKKIFRTEGIWPYRITLDTVVHYRTKINPKAFMNVGGLLSEHNENWAKFRSIVNPVLMQPRTVKMYVPKMDKVASEFIDKIRAIRDPQTNEVPGTFEEIINLWTLEAVSIVALDTYLGLLKDNSENDDAKRIINAVSKIFVLTVDLDANPSIWRLIKTPKYYELMKAFDELTEISGKYINEAIKRIESESTNEKNENDESVLEKLLKHDKKVAVVMATDMLMAGVDTTTTAFTGCLLMLAKNQEKQEKLRKEIKKILPTKNIPLTAENMKNLPYLRACIKEALRMYPVVPGNARAAGQNIVLNGYQIPKGTDIVMVSDYEDTQFDYNKPKEFIPERWLRAHEEQHKQDGCPETVKPDNPFMYLPFGFGPRSCIGKRIAELEIETAISKIIRNYHVEFNYPIDDIFVLNLIFVPNKELKFKFTDIID